MSGLKIAVSSMTNADFFLEEEAAAAMKQLKACGAEWMEVSQHIQLDEETIPELMRAVQEQGIGISPVDLLGWCSGRAPLLHMQDLKVCAPESGAWMQPGFGAGAEKVPVVKTRKKRED